MSRLVNTDPRSYRSELRDRRAEETRERILDATTQLMARGLANLSIPAVAREAGVSVPTVYRHFGSKPNLLAALYPHVAHRAGLDQVGDPRSLDELGPAVRAIVERLDSMDDLARAAFASPIAAEARRATRTSRYERIRPLIDSIEPPLRSADRERITRLLMVLVSSGTLRAWRDLARATAEETADDVEWIVRAAVAAMSRDRR